MAEENIGKLMVTIGGDIGDLAKAFTKTTHYINEIKKSVADVNFEQMVKNVSVIARVIKSLRTQTVNGFHDIDLGVRKVGRTLERTNRLLSQMAGVTGKATNNVVNNVNNINKVYNKLGKTMQYTGVKGSKSLHQISGGFGFLGSVLGSHSRIIRAFSHSFIDGLSLMSAEFWVLEMAARTAYRVLMAFPKKAIASVDAFRLSVIKTQALISTFSPKDVDFETSFQNAREYARDLVTEMDILAAYTLGTSFDLQAITQEFMKQGVLIDINKTKAKDAFLNIANAIEIIASGFQAPELQIRQEARALAMGQVDLRATLATELNARLGGQLKERIALWKQEGTFIENIGDLLKGYAASIADIRSTWKSVSALFKTMSDRIIRFGSEAFYDAINVQLRKMTDYLREHEVLLSGKLYAGWQGLITIVSSLKRSYQTLEEPIGKLIELSRSFLHGWGYILVGFLPVAIERVALKLRVLYDSILLIIGAQMTLSAVQREAFSNWNFDETKDLAKQMKEIFQDLSQASKAFGTDKWKLFTQDFAPPSNDFFDEVARRMKVFDSMVTDFKEGLKRKQTGTPKIMSFIDREKIESEYDAFLNATSVKTSRWLDEENRKIEKHRDSLIRNKALLIQDEAALARHILSMGNKNLIGKNLSEVGETNIFETRFNGITNELQKYVAIITEADRQTKNLIDDINAIADIQLMEKAREREKTVSAPGIAISQRYSSPMQKEMSALTEFIKTQQFEIRKLADPRINLLSEKEADVLLMKLDRNSIAERGRIIEESYQKIKDEMAQFDAFIAERTGGKNSLADRWAKENEDLSKAQKKLSKIYTDGLIIEKDYIDKRELMSKASRQRQLLIEEQFNSEMLSKQLSLRKSQLDVAEIELTMGRGAVARERLNLSQQELESELKILDTLGRIGGVGELAWSEQRNKVEELRKSIADLGQTVRETTGTMGQGMQYAMEKYVRDSNSEFEFGVNFIEDSAQGMTSFIGEILDDFRNRDLKSWSEYLTNLVNVFAQAAQKIVAEMMVVKAISFFTGLFSTGASAVGGINSVQTPTSGSWDGGVSSADLPVGIERMASEEFAGSSGIIVHQSINFEIKEPMDAYSFDAYLNRSGGKVKKIVADGIDQSVSFKKQIRGE